MNDIVRQSADGFSVANLPVEQAASILLSLIDRQVKNDRYRHELDRFREGCQQLIIARETESSERNLDREMVMQMTSLLINLGFADQATIVFNNFINNRPRFAQDVCDILLRKFEN